jgi:hypothetical protein
VDKLVATKELFDKLCAIYNVQGGTIDVSKLVEDAPCSTHSYCNHQTKTIHLVGKFSVLTFLHEFWHLTGEKDELQAQKWAVNLFKKLFPVSFNRLKFDTGSGCFIKVDRSERPMVGSAEINPDGEHA